MVSEDDLALEWWENLTEDERVNWVAFCHSAKEAFDDMDAEQEKGGEKDDE